MNNQQIVLLNTLLQYHPNLAVIMGCYHADTRMYRYFAYFRVTMGIMYVQYPVEY